MSVQEGDEEHEACGAAKGQLRPGLHLLTARKGEFNTLDHTKLQQPQEAQGLLISTTAALSYR